MKKFSATIKNEDKIPDGEYRATHCGQHITITTAVHRGKDACGRSVRFGTTSFEYVLPDSIMGVRGMVHRTATVTGNIITIS